MPRVWRHFLKNLAWPVGFATYLFAVVAGAAYVETLFGTRGSVAVVVVFVVFPILAYLIRDMWRDAKEKVERENSEMMRRIKGGY